MTIGLDLWHSNIKIFKKTLYALKNNKTIFLLGIVYLIVFAFVSQIASGLSFFYGLIMLLVQSAILSDYLWIIRKVVTKGSFILDDLKIGYKVYFRKIYISLLLIRFVYFGVEVFFEYFSSLKFIVYMILNIGVFIFLNPLMEIIYQKNIEEWPGFKYSVKFIKGNWLEWFMPNIIILFMVYLLKELVNIIVSLIPIQNVSVIMIISIIVFAVLGQFLINFAMIYRGFLFDLLAKTTRQKRIFTRHLH